MGGDGELECLGYHVSDEFMRWGDGEMGLRLMRLHLNVTILPWLSQVHWETFAVENEV